MLRGTSERAADLLAAAVIFISDAMRLESTYKFRVANIIVGDVECFPFYRNIIRVDVSDFANLVVFAQSFHILAGTSIVTHPCDEEDYRSAVESYPI
jgi:hypothetical protein